MRAKFGRDPMAGSKKVTLKFIIGLSGVSHNGMTLIVQYFY